MKAEGGRRNGFAPPGQLNRYRLSSVRHVMKPVLIGYLVVASLGVFTSPVQACFCPLPELPESFKEARSVFLGKAIQISEPKTLDQNAPVIERGFKIKFKVIRSWKGVPAGASEFTILWLSNCYECLTLPNMNEEYLVFADPLRDDDIWGAVGMCNRTGRVYSNLGVPEVSSEREMKYLDLLAGRAFTVVRPRYRWRL